MAKKWQHRRNDFGSMLATAVVIGVGAGLCCFVCLADSSDFGVILSLAVVMVALFMLFGITWYRYSQSGGQSLVFWHAVARNNREDGLAAQYRPQIVNDRGAQQPVGTNKPITASEARELRVTSSRTWVPSRTASQKQKRDRQK